MKVWYDRKACTPSLELGDKVLVLLPVPGAVFHARYSGPYAVKEKLSNLDYMISTPDRRQHTHVCHVNMLKPYFTCEALREHSPVLLSALADGEDCVFAPSRLILEGRTF